MNVEKNSFTSPKSSSSFSASLACALSSSSVTFLAYQHLLVTAPTFDSTHETTHNNFPENFHSSTHELLVDFEIFNWDFFPLLFFFPLHFQLRSSTFFFRVLPVALSRGSQTLPFNSNIPDNSGFKWTRPHARKKILAMNFPIFFCYPKNLNALLRCPQHTTPSQL